MAIILLHISHLDWIELVSFSGMVSMSTPRLLVNLVSCTKEFEEAEELFHLISLSLRSSTFIRSRNLSVQRTKFLFMVSGLVGELPTGVSVFLP